MQIKEAEKDGRQKEEMAGNKRAKERVAKAGSRRAKAKVCGRLMTSWARGTSSSSRRRKDRNTQPQDAWGGHEDWWQNGVGSLSSLAPAKTDGNRYGALRESDLATPSTSAVEVPIAELMRPPTKRQQRRMADNIKIRTMHSLKCCDECQGQEQEAFPELGALKWGGKTA